MSRKSNLAIFAFGNLIGIIFLLMTGKNCEQYIFTEFFGNLLSGIIFKADIKKQNPFQCLQCNVWQETKRKEMLNWTFETFLQKHYLETLKGALTGYSLQVENVDMAGYTIPFDDAKSFYGEVWPKYGVTMIGIARLNSLQNMLEYVILNHIEGDFMECGVWRGGASIFARSVFVVHKSSKKVYVADSFRGLPPSRSSFDTNEWNKMSFLAVSLETVQHNFRIFGVFDKKSIIFIRGYFNETMPNAHKEIGRLAVLRLDGDMYESCFDVFIHMYSHVSVGGFVIIDDWNDFPCKKAILDLRSELGILEPIHQIDAIAAYWQKDKEIMDYDISALYRKFFGA